MAEETDSSGAKAPGGGDGAAVALGLAAASRARADSFLQKQEALVDLQAEEMRQRNPYEVSHLRLRRFSDYAKAAFEFSAGLIALGLAAGLCLMVWNAAHSDGLVLESFAAPPDLVEKGLSGQVLATQLLDKINTVENASPTQAKPGSALSDSWGDEIKVEIPETGVSISELYRFLRRWLGHETHVSGELVHTADGIAVTVRVSGKSGATWAGPLSGLDGLILKAAEHVVEVTQPSNYGAYLGTLTPPRSEEEIAMLERVVGDPTLPAIEKANAFNTLSNAQRRFQKDENKANVTLRQGLKLVPDHPILNFNFVTSELILGHAEAALALAPAAVRYFDRHATEYFADYLVALPAALKATAAELLGDFSESIRQRRIALSSDRVQRQDGHRRAISLQLSRQHDVGALRDWLRQMPPVTRPLDIASRSITRLQVAAALADWPAVIAGEADAERIVTASPGFGDSSLAVMTQLHPELALAKAMTGDIAAAEALIAPTPSDCYDCIRIRGQIASAARQWGRADYWFAKAVAEAPSIPFALEDWGRSLLGRGKPDAAIEQFKLSNKKGPHFADPLEGWGEALMAKNQSHLALAKFAEAEKYAPNWGRLHLKWGEALTYAGKKDEAKKQFTQAAELDLTPGEKAELALYP